MNEDVEYRGKIELVLTKNQYGWWCEHPVIPIDVAEGWGDNPTEAVISFMEGMLDKPMAILPPEYHSSASTARSKE